MHHNFEYLTEDSDFIILNNIVFNAKQIRNSIIKDYQCRKSDFNFCRKNRLLRKYFREVNNQGIFNRIEWKFWLKEDIKCELISFDQIRKLDELQIRVILDCSSTAQNIGLKVLLNFALQNSEVEEIPDIDSRETIAFQNIYEQNTAYFYSFNSEKICI